MTKISQVSLSLASDAGAMVTSDPPLRGPALRPRRSEPQWAGLGQRSQSIRRNLMVKVVDFV